MALVTGDQVRPGMVVATEVTDRRGRLLIAAGSELSERHVQALRMWGVTHLEVEGDGFEDDSPVDEDPQVVAAAEQAVDAILKHNDPAHPFIAVLRKTAVKRQAEALSRGGDSA